MASKNMSAPASFSNALGLLENKDLDGQQQLKSQEYSKRAAATLDDWYANRKFIDGAGISWNVANWMNRASASVLWSIAGNDSRSKTASKTAAKFSRGFVESEQQKYVLGEGRPSLGWFVAKYGATGERLFSDHTSYKGPAAKPVVRKIKDTAAPTGETIVVVPTTGAEIAGGSSTFLSSPAVQIGVAAIAAVAIGVTVAKVTSKK